MNGSNNTLDKIHFCMMLKTLRSLTIKINYDQRQKMTQKINIRQKMKKTRKRQKFTN